MSCLPGNVSQGSLPAQAPSIAPGRHRTSIRYSVRVPAVCAGLLLVLLILPIAARPASIRDPDRSIWESIRDDRREEVLRYVREHRDEMDAPVVPGTQDMQLDDPQLTALDLAAWMNREDIAKILLANGASLERGGRLRSPLQYAAASGSVGVASLLLEQGADPDALDRNGNHAPLGLAAENDHPEMIELLLSHKANIEIKNQSKITPLGEALIAAHGGIVRQLLEHGAHCNDRNAAGDTTLHMAAIPSWKDEEEALDIVGRILACGVDINAWNHRGETALWPAIQSNRTRVAMLLVDRGADVRSADLSGDTPLHVAARLEHGQALLQQLINKGADINARDHFGRTAFLSAVLNRHLASAEFLLAHGNHVDETDPSGNTALHILSSRYPSPEPSGIAEFLIAKGANVDARTPGAKNGNFGPAGRLTPLHVAAWNNSLDLARILLAHGADANALNDRFEPPLVTSLQQRRLAFSQLLLDGGATADRRDGQSPIPLFIAIGSGQIDAVKLLLDRHADPNVTDGDLAETPMHRAAHAKNAEIAGLLIARGARIEARNRDGSTPLHLAVRAGNPEIVSLLLEAGADANVKDGSGLAPLDWTHDSGSQAALVAHHAVSTVSADAALDGDACRFVEEQVNRGILQELAGISPSDVAFHRSPRNDWDREPLNQAEVEYAFSRNGVRYLLGTSDGQLRYLSRVSGGVLEEAICTFVLVAPRESVVVAGGSAVCEAVRKGSVAYPEYPYPHALAESGGKDFGWNTAYGEKAARMDLDNDGSPDYVVEMRFSSQRGEGCETTYPAILNDRRTDLDRVRNAPLAELGLSCGSTAQPFVFGGVTYIDVQHAPSMFAVQERQVLKLAAGRIGTECTIRTRARYAAERIDPSFAR